MNKNIVLLDLFSGIGGFSLGLTQAGFNITTHYYSEIDKHAIANYRYNFKNAEYVGDIITLDGRTITRPNIITFGSPCQDFSVAGKRAGMEGQRSSLIGQAIRIVTECKPDVFIWENVKGVFSSNSGEDFWAVIQAFTNIGGYRLEWQLLNTSWFLPQNRERIYLIGHLGKRSRRLVFPIRESNRENDGVKQSDETTTIRTLSGGGHSGGNHSSMTLLKMNLKSGFSNNEGGVSSTLQSRDYKGYSNQDMDFVIIAQRGRETGQKLEPQKDDKTNSLTGVQKDNLILMVEHDDKFRFFRDDEKKSGVKGFDTFKESCKVMDIIDNHPKNIIISHYGHKDKDPQESEKSPTLKANSHGHEPMTNNNSNIRRLTEIECERLQGFPDNWTKYGSYDGVIKKISKTQRYKLLGNAVTVEVVKKIGERLLKQK